MRPLFLLILLSILCTAIPSAADTSPATTTVATQTSPGTVEVPKVPGEIATSAEAVDRVQTGISFVKARNWWGLSSIVIWVLMFILKLTKLFDKIGKRWAYIIVPVLGVTAMLLSAFVGGVSWNTAWLVLTSAPVAALANDFFKRGLLGQEPTTTIKP